MKAEFLLKMEEDAKRRDFTINALYQDKDGVIYDPTGLGADDAERKQLRFVGVPFARIEEDNLRLLRYFRFLSTKELKPTMSAIELEEVVDEFKHCFHENVSPERIGKEMVKLLSGPNCASTLELMDTTGFLDILIDGWKDLDGLKAGPWHQFSFTVKEHTFKTVRACEGGSWILKAAALLHDVGKGKCQTDDGHALGHEDAGAELAESTLKKMWRIDNKSADAIVNLVKIHMDAHRLWETKHTEKVWKFIQENRGDGVAYEFLDLLRADCCDVAKENNDWVKFAAKHLSNAKLFSPLPKPIITGKDLMESKCEPGPEFKRALEVAYDFQLRAELSGKEFDKSSALKQSVECYRQLRKNRRK